MHATQLLCCAKDSVQLKMLSSTNTVTTDATGARWSNKMLQQMLWIGAYHISHESHIVLQSPTFRYGVWNCF